MFFNWGIVLGLLTYTLSIKDTQGKQGVGKTGESRDKLKLLLRKIMSSQIFLNSILQLVVFAVTPSCWIARLDSFPQSTLTNFPTSLAIEHY